MRKFSECVAAGSVLMSGMMAAIYACNAMLQHEIFFFFILNIMGVIFFTWFVQELTDVLRKEEQ